MSFMTATDSRPLSLRRAADLLQALGHPIRLQILELVRREERTVGALVDALGLEQPVISRHLAVLRDAGVLVVRPDGRLRVYQLGGVRAKPLLEALFDSRTVH
jgi:DNA-binding transcriptional ArsR family regulator